MDITGPTLHPIRVPHQRCGQADRFIKGFDKQRWNDAPSHSHSHSQKCSRRRPRPQPRGGRDKGYRGRPQGNTEGKYPIDHHGPERLRAAQPDLGVPEPVQRPRRAPLQRDFGGGRLPRRHRAVRDGADDRHRFRRAGLAGGYQDPGPRLHHPYSWGDRRPHRTDPLPRTTVQRQCGYSPSHDTLGGDIGGDRRKTSSSGSRSFNVTGGPPATCPNEQAAKHTQSYCTIPPVRGPTPPKSSCLAAEHPRTNIPAQKHTHQAMAPTYVNAANIVSNLYGNPQAATTGRAPPNPPYASLSVPFTSWGNPYFITSSLSTGDPNCKPCTPTQSKSDQNLINNNSYDGNSSSILHLSAAGTGTMSLRTNRKYACDPRVQSQGKMRAPIRHDSGTMKTNNRDNAETRRRSGEIKDLKRELEKSLETKSRKRKIMKLFRNDPQIIYAEGSSQKSVSETRLAYDPMQPQYSPTYDPDPTCTTEEYDRSYNPNYPGYYD